MTTPNGKVLLVDYGGVLTGSIGDSFESFETDHDLEPGTVYRILSQAYVGDHGGLIGQFERGEVTKAAFEEALATLLRKEGRDVDPDGLIARLFRFAGDDGGMWEVVARAQAAGIRTGLLSNSWGTDWYPYDKLNEIFDDLVISGDVGLRKPDPAIYQLAMDRFGATPEQCAFVDDLHHNVHVADELGMHGVLHESVETTVERLEPFLGVSLT
ncbi:MAG: HAD family phosphatase [Nitriliruptorales bacterium]|nr:HAD family phosphatase [Nitriliruptorales bacterium]